MEVNYVKVNTRITDQVAVTAVDQEGYVGDNRYLDDYETDDDNLGPNAPGYIP